MGGMREAGRYRNARIHRLQIVLRSNMTRNNERGVWLGLKIFRSNELDFAVTGSKMWYRTSTSSS